MRWFEFTVIVYDDRDNRFYDENGNVIVNMLEFVSANDLYLFHHDHGNSIFPHKGKKDCFIEIATED